MWTSLGFRIGSVLGLFVAIVAILFFASRRTRKLAVFAVLVVVIGAALAWLAALVRVWWLTLQPF